MGIDHAQLDFGVITSFHMNSIFQKLGYTGCQDLFSESEVFVEAAALVLLRFTQVW